MLLFSLLSVGALPAAWSLIWTIGENHILHLQQRSGATSHRITANWLRERCSSASCIDHDSQQPLFDPHLVDDVTILSVVEMDGQQSSNATAGAKHSSPSNLDPQRLRVSFSDDTVSDFDVLYLLREIENEGPSPMQGPVIELPDTHLWNASLRAPPVYSYHTLDLYMDHMLGQLLSMGLVVLEGVPRTTGFCTEFGQRVSTVRETEWGREFNVRTQPDTVTDDNPNSGAGTVKKDLAYTGLSIGLHTDNPYRDPVPDYQLLHQIGGCDCGGDPLPCATCATANQFSDSFAVAAQLYREDRDSFDLLSSINVRWENNGGDGAAMLMVHKPVIELDSNHITSDGLCDKRMSRSNATVADASSMPEDGIVYCILAVRHSAKSGGYTPLLEPTLSDRFFRARRKFSAMLSAPENVVTHYLQPGQMVLVDNKRVLHARSTVVSDVQRFLQGCYLNRDGIQYRFSRLVHAREHSPGYGALEQATFRDWVHMGETYASEVDAKVLSTMLDMLEAQRGRRLGAPVDLWQHGLQTATRALRSGEGADIVVMSLLHDMTESLVSKNHGGAAASLLEPYLDPKATWMLEHHEVFQGFYYLHHFGADRNLRDQFKDSPYYDDLVRWCHVYDQASFDPAYPNLSTEHFLPMLREVFSRDPYWWNPFHPKAAVVTGAASGRSDL